MKRAHSESSTDLVAKESAANEPAVKKGRTNATEAKKYIEENYPVIVKHYGKDINNIPDMRGLTSSWAQKGAPFSPWSSLVDDLDAIARSPDEWHRNLLAILIEYIENPTKITLNAILATDLKKWSSLFLFVSYVFYQSVECVPMLLKSEHLEIKNLFIRQIGNLGPMMNESLSIKKSVLFGSSESTFDRALILFLVKNEEIAKMLIYMIPEPRINIITILSAAANPTIIKTLIAENYDTLGTVKASIKLGLAEEAQQQLSKYTWKAEHVVELLKVKPTPQTEGVIATLVNRFATEPIVLMELCQLFAHCHFSVSCIKKISALMPADWIKTTIVPNSIFKKEWSVEHLLVKGSSALYSLYASVGVDVDRPIALGTTIIHPLVWITTMNCCELYSVLFTRYSYDPYSLFVRIAKDEKTTTVAMEFFLSKHSFSINQLIFALSLCRNTKNQQQIMKALNYKEDFEIRPLEIKKAGE